MAGPKTVRGFHAGEIRVQERAGVREVARRREGIIHGEVPPRAREFLQERRMVIVGSVDEGQRPWASVLTGEPGFAQVPDPGTVRLESMAIPGDPLGENLDEGRHVGLLAIDLERRMRMRVNGRMYLDGGGGLVVETEQVYANCPKYIQSRRVSPQGGPTDPATSRRTASLTDAQRARVREADTFFIATANPGEGVDVSHRGGLPGFVQVDGDRLTWPDYAGNAMFCTLGNIALHPRAGVTFVDFAQGSLLQLTGRAGIDWDPARSAEVRGAERLVSLEVEDIVEIRGALPFGWTLEEYSPFNP